MLFYVSMHIKMQNYKKYLSANSNSTYLGDVYNNLLQCSTCRAYVIVFRCALNIWGCMNTSIHSLIFIDHVQLTIASFDNQLSNSTSVCASCFQVRNLEKTLIECIVLIQLNIFHRNSCFRSVVCNDMIIWQGFWTVG